MEARYPRASDYRKKITAFGCYSNNSAPMLCSKLNEQPNNFINKNDLVLDLEFEALLLFFF